MTSHGKLDVKSLPEPEINAEVEYTPPSTQIEAVLVEIWSEVLKLDKEIISTRSTFFELGGHSLNAITIVNKIYKRINVKVPLKEFFVKPTIMLLAEYVDAQLWLCREPDTEVSNKIEVIV